MTHNINKNQNNEQGIEERLKELRNFSAQAREYNLKGPEIEPALKAIDDFKLPKGSLFYPFWILTKHVNDELAMPEHVKDNTPRIVRVGIASDNGINQSFAQEVLKSNEFLKKHGIEVVIGENVQIELPFKFEDNELSGGIKYSFSNPQDFYFAITTGDLKEEKNDFAVKALTKSGVDLIDKGLSKKDISTLVANEILRYFSGAKDTTYSKRIGDVSGIDEKAVRRNLWKPYHEKGYDANIDKGKERIVTVNIGLDGTTKKQAEEIIKDVYDIFEKEFGIGFRMVDTYNFKMPDKWKDDEMDKVRAAARNPSDIYLLFTQKDWTNLNDSTYVEAKKDTGSVAGLADSYHGWSWIETQHDKKLVVQIAAHEIGHLFRGSHVYLRDEYMHPNTNPENPTWSPRNRQTILKNKYRTWEWSPKQ